jgi:replicative DNA helicase
MNELLDHVDRHQTIPTREYMLAHVHRELGVDSPHNYEIEQLIKRPASPRDYPMVKDRLDEWAKHRQVHLIYESDVVESYRRGDIQAVIDVVEKLHTFNHAGYQLFSFYDQIGELFVPSNIIHRPMGYHKLDKIINDGGPSPGEVVVFMAPTNVGKSLVLCNIAIKQTLLDCNVLFVSFEMQTIPLVRRMAAIAATTPVSDLLNHESMVTKHIGKMYQTHKKDIKIAVLPPDECSVDHVMSVVDDLRRLQNFRPDVIILDYMDLMVSRRNGDNENDYSRQKYVANQICGLAKKTGTVVYSATQTNRAGNKSDEIIDVTKAAESYGKTMPLDYIVTLNQSPEENATGKMRAFVAKNRNGARFQTVDLNVSYSTMIVGEVA